ncbi:hypothetical protein BN1723_010551 [Verticillium longisporum]|uniref:Mre11 DNA-binding domain-containing protein n=1 Tax=Verticillium longisporum TaxID=100787 RepID=A0A0G4KZH8_VERLO|nr:hypothetical protein BN1723_010551 [Verticillium longisporum]
MSEFTEADTIRILVATDNHVGYEERDPIRKDDSWRTFDEIMEMAKKEDVDMVLLGGDLFHDNKPSRKSMYQVMRTLRRNCLGMKPCELEFLSDANETGFHVMQPGSSVATSLVAGEAVPKHVAVVSITGKDFKIKKLPLKTVRPFVTKDIVLATDKRFKGVDKMKDNRQELTKRLMKVVDEMIEQANADWLAIQDEDEDVEEAPPLPLIRLKVEYTAPEGGQYDCENPQRFSNRFVGKVANTNDVVYFHRKKTTASRSKQTAELPEGIDENLGLDTVKVEALVQEFLAAQSLKILPQAPFGDAVNQFVNKDDKHAMESFVSDSLASQVKQMLNLDSDDEDLDSAMEKIRATMDSKFSKGLLKMASRRTYKAKPEEWDSDLDGHWEDQPEALEVTPAGTGRAPVQGQDEDAMELSEEEAPVKKAPAKRGAAKTAKAPAVKKAPAKKAPAKKAPARGRGKKAVSEDEDEDEDVVMDDDPFADDPAPQPKRAQRSQPARAPAKGRQTKLNFSQAAASQKAVEISDDEISGDDDFEPAPPTTRSRRR